jgi:hypothetical protein
MNRTIDCFTRPGSVQLVNDLPGSLEADYLAIKELERKGQIFALSKEVTK